MNTITIELSAEDRAALHRLTLALEAISLPTPVPATLEQTEEEPKPATTPEQDIEAAVPFDTKPEPGKPQPEITLADIRKKVQALAAPSTGKNAAVKEIVNHFAPRVSDIPPERYAEVMQLLTALEEA